MDSMEEDALSEYVEALAGDECYGVVRVLKKTAHETTEVVYFTGVSGGELGPFVRKRISSEACLGAAYSTLRDAQRSGRRYRYLPRIYDVHERDDATIVIMEYVSGCTLHDKVYESDASVELAAEIFGPLCDGVIELHEGFSSPLIHRDLKPSNVIVSEGGLTIIDFGIARIYHEDAQTDTAPFGTRAYAPPEQFGFGQTDERSDIYALGAVLYYLLCERNPSPAEQTQGFPALAALPSLQAVVRRACAFDPAARYQHVRDLKAAFLEALDQSSVPTLGKKVVPAPPTSLPVLLPGQTAEPLVTAPRFVNVSRNPAASSAAHLVAPSEIVGLVWDGLVIAAWFLFMLVLVIGPFLPAEQQSDSYPLWFQLLLFPLCLGLFSFSLVYGALDKRVLRRCIPFMSNQTFGRGLVVALILLGISLALLVVLGGIVAVTDNFGAGLSSS